MRLLALPHALALVAALGAASGCAVNVNRARDVTPAVELPLRLGVDYDVIGDVDGAATRTLFLGFPTTQSSNADRAGVLTGTPSPRGKRRVFGNRDFTAEMAIYDAIQKTPGADAIVFPKFKRKRTGIPIFYSTETVTVRGKAVHLKNTATAP